MPHRELATAAVDAAERALFANPNIVRRPLTVDVIVGAEVFVTQKIGVIRPEWVDVCISTSSFLAVLFLP